MFNKFKKTRAHQKRRGELDRILIEALYEVAREGELKTNPDPNKSRYNEIPKDPDVFLWDVFLLSEHYLESNTVLSASLWGIWCASSYMRLPRHRSIVSNIFETKRKKDNLFRSYRAFVATAVVQFADPSPAITGIGNALNNLDRYESNALKAIKALKDCVPSKINTVASTRDEKKTGVAGVLALHDRVSRCASSTL